MKKSRNDRTRFKAFITKYALTKGILEEEVEDCFSTCATMVRGEDGRSFYHRNDWHLRKEDAIFHAEKMREDKLKSIDKQRKRIEGLKFS